MRLALTSLLFSVFALTTGCAASLESSSSTFQPSGAPQVLGPMPQANSPRNDDQSPRERNTESRTRTELRERVRVNEVCLRCR